MSPPQYHINLYFYKPVEQNNHTAEIRVGGSKNPIRRRFSDRGLLLIISVACDKLIFLLRSGADNASLLILQCPGLGVV